MRPRFRCKTEGCKNYAKTIWCKIYKIFEAGRHGYCKVCLTNKNLKPCPGCGGVVNINSCSPCFGCYHDAVEAELKEMGYNYN